MSRILYIGNFELPDRNAAAHRVLGIAKSLRMAGNEVFFLNTLINYSGEGTIKDYEGFTVYECRRPPKTSVKRITELVIKRIRDFSANVIIAYNFNALACLKIYRYCKKRGIKVYGDITEWYSASGNLFNKVFKKTDSELRMRYVNKKIDGLIVISRYLEDYYKKQRTITVPPTVDLDDAKWDNNEYQDDKKIFVFSGMPGKKERLDLMIEAFSNTRFIESKIELHIIGVDEARFRKIYNYSGVIGKNVIFLGRISHIEAVNECKRALWSVILRERIRLVQAGFPTKFVESISCKTPVLANDFSNIREFSEKYGLGIIFDNQCSLPTMLNSVIEMSNEQYKTYKNNCAKCTIFDYRYWKEQLGSFVNSV